MCRTVASRRLYGFIGKEGPPSQYTTPPLIPVCCCSYDRYQCTKTRLNSRETSQSAGRIIAWLCVNGVSGQFKYRMYCTTIKSHSCLNRRAVQFPCFLNRPVNEVLFGMIYIIAKLREAIHIYFFNRKKKSHVLLLYSLFTWLQASKELMNTNQLLYCRVTRKAY